ncbi:MAG: putative DNA binding domain-containing protein [Candidatus Cloacimonetes bacterium]|nr:putative DNA binding domain-containing protein [Candidatus Cloacimonadota bacterium]
MTKEQVLDLIRGGEGQTVEFKEKLSKPTDFAATMVSFANTNDGYILLGVADDKTITGIDWDIKKEEWVLNVSSNNCTPRIVPLIEAVSINNKTIVVLTILEAPDKPYKANNIYYIRIGATSRPAKREEEMQLMQAGGFLYFEKMPVRNALWEDLNQKKINAYFSNRAPYLINAKEKEQKEALFNLEFLTNGQGVRPVPTNAGILCLGSFPQKFITQARITCAHFGGKERTAPIIDRTLLEGPIDEQIKNGVDFVKKNMHIGLVHEGYQKKEIPEHSLRAVQEALANAVAHRDYLIYGQEIMLLMFDDRLEVVSPGGLAGKLTRENFDRVRYSRNPILTRFLHEMKLVERLGRGIRLIRDEMKKLETTPPQFIIEPAQFTVILPAKQIS